MSKKKLLDEAKGYKELRDQLGRDQIENFKFLKAQVADWYIAISAACFAIGGISVSLAGNDIKHPALFWWGSVLLITNGVFIFFIRKAELDSEFSGFPDLRQKEADLWTMSKVAEEYADGDTSRADVFKKSSERFTKDYNSRSTPFTWWKWATFSIQSSLLNLAFGFLLFPVLLLASQLPNYIHITLLEYTQLLVALILLYVSYMGFGIYNSIKQKIKTNNAEAQIKQEVTRQS